MNQPLLYDMYIGQYKRNGCVKAPTDVPLSTILFQQLDGKLNEDELAIAKKEYYEQNKHGYYKNASTEKWYYNNKVSVIRS